MTAIQKSRHHIGFAEFHGATMELLKGEDYYMLAPIESPVLTDGDRFGRFFCHGAWEPTRVFLTMETLGYKIIRSKAQAQLSDAQKRRRRNEYKRLRNQALREICGTSARAAREDMSM